MYRALAEFQYCPIAATRKLKIGQYARYPVIGWLVADIGRASEPKSHGAIEAQVGQVFVGGGVKWANDVFAIP